MNTFAFIQKFFAAKVLPELSDDPVADSIRSLTMNHRLQNGNLSRLTGWALITKEVARVQSKLAAPGVMLDERTRYQAWLEEIPRATPEFPLLLVGFEQALISPARLFLTFDPRAVRICGPKEVETFDFTQGPGQWAGRNFKVLAKARDKAIRNAAEPAQ